MTLAVAIVGAATGIVGIILAFWSIRRQVVDDRLNLRIGSSWGINTQYPSQTIFIISITNLSKFPVTIREAGLYADKKQNRLVCLEASLTNGERIPVRMEPRTSISVCFPPQFVKEALGKNVCCAYAATDCGETVESKGDSVRKVFAPDGTIG